MSNYIYPGSVAQSDEQTRAEFIRNTYLHLAFAVLGFVSIEFFLLNSPLAGVLAGLMTGGNYSWLIVLALFIGVSYLADRWARSSTSQTMQYMGLGIYVVAQAIIFIPILLYASIFAPDIIGKAGMITLLLFAGLTYAAFTSGKDFSFLGGILKIGGLVALGFIALSIIFGFSLGLLFSLVMILFAGGSILYNTSNIIHHYQPSQYVAAALSLFASVALLFWYVLQFLLSITSSD